MKKIAKKMISLLLAAIIVMSFMPIEEISKMDFNLPDFNFLNLKANAETSEYFTYTVDEYGNATITGCDDSVSGDITIPSTIDGYPITAIGQEAFSGNDDITSITILDNVTIIEFAAFRYCTNLVSVTIGKGVTFISSGVFEGCISLTNITVDAENEAYSSDDNGVLFNKDKSILIKYPIGNRRKRYSIPYSVETIENFAFDRCNYLSSMIIPGNVTNISYCSFQSCSSLKIVIIEKGVTSIDLSAFRVCSALKTIIIPDSVTSIDAASFYYCSALTDVYYTGTQAEWELIEIDYSHNDNLLNADIHFDFKFSYPVLSLDETVTTEINSDECLYLFIPEESGTYYFTSHSNDDTYGCLYDENMNLLTSDDDDGSVLNFLIEYNFTAGEVYYFGVGYYSSGLSGSFDVSLIEGLPLNERVTAEINSGKCRYLFVPEETGTYYFTSFSSTDTRGYLYDESQTLLTSDDDNGENYNFFIEYNLTKGKIYYFEVGYFDVDKSGSFSIELLDKNTFMLPLNKSVTTKIYSGEHTYFTFIPEESGTYYFTSYSNDDTFGYLYDKDFNQIVYNDDGGSNYNFLIEYSLTAGEVYYLCVKYYSNNKSGNFNVAITNYNPSTPPNLQSNYYTYIVDENGNAKIIDVDESISGDVVIPSTFGGYPVTSIGDRAFYRCTSLTSITIPDSVTSIGDSAFYRCTILTNITIPEGVTSIGNYAFSYCYNFTNITIPEGVTSIGNYAFYYCYNLTSITVDSANTAYSSDEYGVLFNKDKTILIQYPAGNTRTNYAIPDSVTSIDDSAFESCILTSITIPDSVTSIGDDAFFGCSSLTSVTIPDSVTSIGDSAFLYCNNLTNVYYTGSEDQWNAISIGDHNDPLINADIHYIAKGECGNSLTWSFDDSTGILTISGTGDMYDFQSYDQPWYRFAGNISEITIEDGVTSVGNYAFYSCESLTNIIIPDSVINIGEYAFAYCESLTDVDLPDRIATIPEYMFYNCTNLQTVNLPQTIVEIKKRAFYACSSLSYITIPGSMEIIGLDVWGKCYALKGFNVDSSNAYFSNDEFGILYDKAKKKLIKYPDAREETVFNIPETVQTVGELSFAYCKALEKIVIPNSVTTIEVAAFSACDNLKEVVFSEDSSLVSINEEAFAACISLEKINLPQSLERIDHLAFCYTLKLEDIKLPPNLKYIGAYVFDESAFYNNANNWENNKSSNDALYLDNCLLCADYDDDDKTVFEVKYGTKLIAAGAFELYKKVSKIVVPATVLHFSEGSFETDLDASVVCNKNSPAHLYCVEKNIPFILVDENVKSLKIKTLINKTDYYVGESLDTAGLMFSAEYEDGTVYDVYPGNITFSAREFDKTGKKYIVAKLGDKQASFFVNVIAGVPSTVEINELPEKLVYTVGETLDTTGLSLNVVYDNSNTKIVTEGITASCDLSSPGTKTVTVNYTENEVTVSASYQITVNPRLPDTVVSVDSVSASAGDKISVPFRIENNKGFMGFAITVNYDSEAFTPVSVTPGDVLKTGTLNDSIGTAYEYLKIVFVTSEDIKNDGELFTVDFIVNENAIGDYSFDVSYLQADTFNENLDDVVLECSDFDVDVSNTIVEESVVVSGGMLDAEAGKTIKVPVTVENGVGINSFLFRTKYNSEVMSFVSVSKGDVLTGNINATVDSSTCEVVFDWSGSPVVSDGVLFYIEFNIPEYVQSNEIVPVLCDDMTFSGGIKKDVICIDAQVNITNPDGGLVPVIYSDDYIIVENSIIEVPIYIKNNHGIMGYRLDFEYDSSVITPVSASSKMTCGGSFANNIGANDGNFKVLWSYTENFYDDCLLFTVKFSVADGVKPETLPLSVTYSQQDTYNENWEDVPLNIRIPQIPIRNVYTAKFMADGVLVATRTFTVETEKLDEPAVPQKAGYIGAWSGYTIKAEDMVINAKYYLPEAIMMSKVTLKTDESTRLLASCNFDATHKKWSSSNPSVATVDKHGNVTAVGEGKCEITVTCYGKDSFGNDIKASTKTEIVVNKPLNAETLKERFRAAFDEFFQVKLHDIVFNFKEFMIILFRYAY